MRIIAGESHNGQTWVPGNDPTRAYCGYEVVITILAFRQPST